MKKLPAPLKCITALALLLAMMMAATPLNAQRVKTSLFLQKYRSIFLGIGPRFLNTDPGTIVTNFVDDSPSMDAFNSTFDVKDGYFQLGVNFGYKFGRYRGLSHDILLDVSTSANYSAKFAYSIGWNFLFEKGDKNLVVRPALQAVAGNQVFAIGQIENNASYIQIGQTQYYEDALDVELRSESFFLAPRVDVSYIFAERWDVFFKAALDLAASNSNPRLGFDVPEDLRTEESPSSSSRSIDGDNPQVFFEGEKLESLPYKTSGLRVSIGISYLWNR